MAVGHLLHHLFFLSIFLNPVSRPDESNRGWLSFKATAASCWVLFHMDSNLDFVFGCGNAKAARERMAQMERLCSSPLPLMSLRCLGFKKTLRENTWFLKLGTWISLGYQISFPSADLGEEGSTLVVEHRIDLPSVDRLYCWRYGLWINPSVCLCHFHPRRTSRHRINQTLSLKFFRRKIAGIKIMSGIGD